MCPRHSSNAYVREGIYAWNYKLKNYVKTYSNNELKVYIYGGGYWTPRTKLVEYPYFKESYSRGVLDLYNCKANHNLMVILLR